MFGWESIWSLLLFRAGCSLGLRRALPPVPITQPGLSIPPELCHSLLGHFGAGGLPLAAIWNSRVWISLLGTGIQRQSSLMRPWCV